MFRDKVNDADMEGNLRHQYDTIMAFFSRNLRYVQPGDEFNTQGVLEISYDALSELVMNALIHRSLVRPAPIRIFILDDRIEIHSPGTLPRGLAVADIEKGTSMPRNEQLFYHANFLLPYSGAGTGILRALNEGEEIKFENNEYTKEFVVTIPRKVDLEATSSNHEDKPAHQNELAKEPVNGADELAKGINEPSNATKEPSIGKNKLSNELATENQEPANEVATVKRPLISNKEKDIINFCSVPRSAQEILDRVGVTNQTRHRKKYIQPLVDAGYLKKLTTEKGGTKGQRYVKFK